MAPLQEQVVPVEFSNGVDTKTDPKAVVVGRFLRVENGVFTAPGRIQKRPGNTALGTTIASVGTLSAPSMVHSYNDELIAADQNLLLSYSSNQDAWISKGNYTSVELSRTILSEQYQSTGVSDVAIFGNYALYGYADAANSIWGSVVDLTTGGTLVNSAVYAASSFEVLQVKCLTLGGTTLCIIYRKASTAGGGQANQYFARTVTFSGSGVVTFSAETQLTTTASGLLFDAVATATGGAFIYSQSATPGITVSTLSTALAISSTTFAAANPFNVHISTTSNNNIWAYWNISTNDGAGNLTSLSLRYAVVSSTLSSVLAATTIAALASPYYVSNMITKSNSASQQTLYYGQFITNGGGGRYLEYSNQVTATDAGVIGTPSLFAYGVCPVSHSFTVGSKNYAAFVYRTTDLVATMTSALPTANQPTLFIVELNYVAANQLPPPYVVARFAQGTAISYNYNYTAILTSANVASFSSTKFYLTSGILVQAAAGSTTYIGAGEIQAYSYSFDFNSSNGYIAKNSGNLAVLNGANLQMYDGAACVELGFHLFPEVTNVTTSGAGNVASGTYNYIAIYQWVDNQGNLHQSEPSLPKTYVNVGSNALEIRVTTTFLSAKLISVALFRTTGAGGTTGSTYYLVNSIGVGLPGGLPLAGVIAVADNLADASITSRNQPYTYPASSVLDNTAPAPSMIMIPHNNRLWFVDSENPNTIWYTKSAENQVGISPSAFLTQEIDPKFGPITGLAEMDEKLIIGKKTGFFVQSGDGANDVGSGSTLSFPQTIPSDVGISQAKGTITLPNGVMFKSDNGIYLLTRNLQVGYIGADVESYNSQTVTGATLVPGKSQVRFLCSSGYTLVYDYIFNKWATFTNYTGTSSTAWNGLYVYATTSGSIFKESSSSYLDNATAYSLLIQTSWLSFASIQGFQRIKRLIMLGDFTNGNSASHNLSVQAAYDFSTTFQSAITYAFGAASASGVFQYRERLPQQKCDSLSLLIQETTTGSSAEYVDLTNISFEAGVKRGVNKLGGTKSVG